MSRSSSQDSLREEAREKFSDPRYSDTLKEWMRDKLVEVYGKKMDPAIARRIVNKEWGKAHGGKV